MKILNVLNEDMGGMGAALAYKNLTSLQIGLLKKITSGKFDYDMASPQTKDAVEELISMGLVDELSFDLTDRGQAALQLAAKHGGFDRRALAHRQVSNDNPMDDDDNDADIEVDPFEID